MRFDKEHIICDWKLNVKASLKYSTEPEKYQILFKLKGSYFSDLPRTTENTKLHPAQNYSKHCANCAIKKSLKQEMHKRKSELFSVNGHQTMAKSIISEIKAVLIKG